MTNKMSPIASNAVLLAALIQLVNALDFMMIMPLGPDLARDLSIPPTWIGYLGGGYTLAAALSSLVFAKFIDRFDRKHVTIITLLGLSLATLFCAYAWDMKSLFTARILAGLFAGPATSIALAIVTDQVPFAHRGRAMAIVMGAFSVAAIAVVPFGLKLSLLFGWGAPFLVASALGAITLFTVWLLLPNMTAHIAAAENQNAGEVSLLAMLGNRLVMNAFMAMGIAIFSTFLIVPHLAPWLQFNLGVPRDAMSLYYALGGVASLIVLQWGGRLIDRLGALRITLAIAVLVIFLLWDGFMHTPWLPPLVIFTLFMSLTATRTIAAAAVNTQVPRPWERAAFMSLQSVSQHLFSGMAAVVSSMILIEVDGGVGNFEKLAGLSVLLTLIQPLFLYLLMKKLRNPQEKIEQLAAKKY
jgi:predicted MFS family arabinose efflux permease